ncbi:hypothetical protein BKA67DRAFT_567812 [Truncatella angustata]|uniref:Uncharacterized protein n=1 Tax=Truncatella angustata TaxID=152316 RepID=A0A9P8UIA8_9PEZI|nr:uncharacterized protein BKA67DRAFT_567812 [Truncatella angustata]KAH6652883.1 hypothetical protein BKA67DRAFT_567812 [Truncatella angustata]
MRNLTRWISASVAVVREARSTVVVILENTFLWHVLHDGICCLSRNSRWTSCAYDIPNCLVMTTSIKQHCDAV